MVDTLLTRGEMERNLSQSVQAYYRHQLGCRTDKVNCHIINEQVAIAIHNPITHVEKFLSSKRDRDFVRDLRARIDTIVKNELSSTIEKIAGVQVIALTIDTALDNNLTGIVALLAQKPKLRDAKRNTTKLRVKSQESYHDASLENSSLKSPE